MNIFYLSHDPVKAAQMMTDKHVVKMLVESGQILSTCKRILDGEEEIVLSKNNRKIKYWKMKDKELEEKLYRPSHYNHPSVVWARATSGNYKWLVDHFLALSKEYEKRFGRVHLTYEKLYEYIKEIPRNIAEGTTQSPALAMPEQYIVENCVQSYRNYYEAEKLKEQHDIERYNRETEVI